MSTLSTLATFVSTKVNLTEADDIAACKTYLTRRFEMIWAEGLWKDSVIMFESALTASGSSLTTALWLPSRGTFVCPAIVDRVLNVRTDLMHLNIQRQEYYFRIDYDAFARTGTPGEFLLLYPVAFEVDASTDLSWATSADAGAIINTKYLDQDGVSIVDEDITLVGGNNDIGTTLAIISASKPTTTDQIELVDTIGNILLTIPAASTALPIRQRFRLMLNPSAPTTNIRVLAKRTVPRFSEDNDQPQLTNVENVLIAYAHADMLVRARQYGKAQLIAQEATGLLDQLKRIETIQQAHNQRLIPESGFGSEWDFRGQPGLSF